MNFRHSVIPLIFFTITLFSILSGCSGDGDSSSPSNTGTGSQEAVNVSSVLYGNNPSFKQGQVVILESDIPFSGTESLVATDSSGNGIEVRGLSDGTAILVLPFNSPPGSYPVEIKRGINTTNLTLDVTAVTLPLNPEIYVEGIINQLSNQINDMILAQGDSPDPSLTELASDLNNLDLGTISQDEISRIANLFYVNLDAFFNSSNNASPAQARFAKITSPSLSRSSSRCVASKIILVTEMVQFAVLAGVAAVDPEPVTKVLFFGTALLASNNLITGFGDYFTNCPGTILNSFVNKLSTAKLARSATTNTASKILYAEKVNASPTIYFYDGDAKSVTLTVTEVPSDELSSLLSKFKNAANSISFLIPNTLLSSINNLGQPVAKDLTSEIKLEQINNPGIVCNGTPSAYTCGFPPDNGIYDQETIFSFEITHPDYDDVFIQKAKVLPRDVPVIEDQRFSVIIGPGNINRIQIQAVEDINSPNYELTKVTGFKILSGPGWGVILNDFNSFTTLGQLDFAADLDGAPTSTQIVVQAWNRYGWSDSAVITLDFNQVKLNGPQTSYGNPLVYDPINMPFIEFTADIQLSSSVNIQSVQAYAYTPYTTYTSTRYSVYLSSAPYVIKMPVDNIHTDSFRMSLTVTDTMGNIYTDEMDVNVQLDCSVFESSLLGSWTVTHRGDIATMKLSSDGTGRYTIPGPNGSNRSGIDENGDSYYNINWEVFAYNNRCFFSDGDFWHTTYYSYRDYDYRLPANTFTSEPVTSFTIYSTIDGENTGYSKN